MDPDLPHLPSETNLIEFKDLTIEQQAQMFDFMKQQSNKFFKLCSSLGLEDSQSTHTVRSNSISSGSSLIHPSSPLIQSTNAFNPSRNSIFTSPNQEDDDIKGLQPSIFVISNRLPFSLRRNKNGQLERHVSHGGLVTALAPVVRQQKGKWIGWPGLELLPGETIPDTISKSEVKTTHTTNSTIVIPETETDTSHQNDSLVDIPTSQLISIPITSHELEGYYFGFSNATLWPLFHSMPGRVTYSLESFNMYKEINQRFADRITKTLDEHSSNTYPLIWIHDYQLCLVPQMIRAKSRPVLHRTNGVLAFFLHIPFPPYDIFRLLPWDKNILLGLLGCDLLGFHIQQYADNFMACLVKILGARVDYEKMTIDYGGRQTRIGVFPIGIPYSKFNNMARKASVLPQTQKLILGVDRLDPTKGIPHRLKAFSLLLKTHPELICKVRLLQIAVPSRASIQEYRLLKTEIDTLVGEINGEYSTDTWSPIQYIYRGLAQSALAPLYRDASVCFVTPLRDGMNLVCKEFVACQTNDPGVLILSRFTGSATTMREALLVNPHNTPQTAKALYRALTMPLSERQSRINLLKNRELKYDVHHWTKTFLHAAHPRFASGSYAKIRPIQHSDFNQWLSFYLHNRKLTLFLDYDGTLAEICEHPSKAFMSDRIRAALNKIITLGQITVVIISGRKLEDVEKMVGIPDITYAGNHGLEIQIPGKPRYLHDDLVHFKAEIEDLATTLEKKCCTDGAWVEKKGPTLTWHFRSVKSESKRKSLVKICSELIENKGFQVRKAHCALEARPPIGWDKGRAALFVLRSIFGASWTTETRVIYCGDDETDEDAFRILSGLAQTFRLGRPENVTFATHRLSGPRDVGTLLEWLLLHYNA